MKILYLIDIVVFALFSINTLYLLIFSIASLFGRRQKGVIDSRATPKRVAVLIAAYREDEVIAECVAAALNQNYTPQADVVVISDSMTDATNESLSKLPITLLKVGFVNSTKAKALNYAMVQIDESYDLALILDADNTIAPNFLTQIATIFQDDSVKIAQAHRCAKNTNTPLSMLDAVSEEINNSIFRLGHANLGLSAALIGSGMVFDFKLFKSTMASIDAVGGFDRALELKLIKEGFKIEYIAHADVKDEKVQRGDDFSRQRRRWLAAQWHYMKVATAELPSAIVAKNWDFCDKAFQQMTLPRLILLGFTLIITIGVTIFSLTAAIKWWILAFLLIFALVAAIPKKMLSKKLLFALIRLPYFFILMSLNLFKLRGANKKFIHTKHGIK